MPGTALFPHMQAALRGNNVNTVCLSPMQRAVIAGLILAATTGAVTARAEGSKPLRISASQHTFLLPIADKPHFRLLRRAIRRTRETGGPERISAIADSLGFFSAVCTSLSSDTTLISLGARYNIDSVSVASPLPTPIDTLLHRPLPIPYDAGWVDGLVKRVVFYHAARGYPFASAAVTLPPSESPLALHVDLEVTPQARCSFAPPLFTTSLKTKPRIILRDVPFAEGELFDVSRVQEATERLLTRPYISSVESGAPLLARNADTPMPSDTATVPVAIPFAVVERSGLGVDGALGAESRGSEKPTVTGLLTVSLLNAFGLGEWGALRYRGERSLQLFGLELGKPWLLGTPLFVSAGFDLEIREKEYGFLEGKFKLLSELKPLWQAGVRIKGRETTIDDSTGSSWRFYGLDLLLLRLAQPRRAGRRTAELSLETGTGVADRSGGRSTRWHLGLTLGGHVPVSRRIALMARVKTRTLFTKEDSLPSVELFRVGGHNSVRGYGEDEFALKNVAFVQTECLFYFRPEGAVYVFVDGGVGFRDDIALGGLGRVEMMGYGLGARLPTRIGSVSVEWARNIRDTRGFGRIHVRFRNPLSMSTGQ